MKIFYAKAPGTIRLALFCAALLLVAWWAGTAWGNVALQFADDSCQHPFYVIKGDTTWTDWPDYAAHWDSKRVSWIADNKEDSLERAGTFAIGTPMADFQLTTDATTPQWARHTDSIAVRIEKAEKRFGRLEWTYFIAGLCFGIGGLIFGIILRGHINQKWTEVHKS